MNRTAEQTKLTPQTEQVINFWRGIHVNLPSEEIANWIEALESGRADWFRNYGLLNITVARYCRVGRIGFDQDKYDRLMAWAEQNLQANGISPASMQN